MQGNLNYILQINRRKNYETVIVINPMQYISLFFRGGYAIPLRLMGQIRLDLFTIARTTTLKAKRTFTKYYIYIWGKKVILVLTILILIH